MRETWEVELEELRRRTELAQRMGGEERVQRQHDAGRLTVRERIDKLLDPGTFHERGAIAGRATYEGTELVEFVPANFVMGTGRIDGRVVVVGGDDFTVRGGASDASIALKQIQAEQMAREFRVPIVRLVDGTGGGGSVKSYDQLGRTYVPANPGWDHVVAALSEVPVVAAALGPVAGLGAARVATSHFALMVKGVSQVFVAGPPVVKHAMPEEPDKEELGGSHIHTRNGTADNEVASEDDALAQIRRFLSYMPSSVWDAPPRGAQFDPPDRRAEELLSVIPRDRRKPYNARRIAELVLDEGSFFESGRLWGRPLITGFGRLHGWPVGVLAGDPLHYAGGLTADASDKLTRFVDLCDTFHLPAVNFVDQPGFVIGTTAERAATIRKGARALVAVYQATVPWVSVIVRKVFGVAGAAHGNAQKLNYRFAWPSGDWGSLPLEGGIEAAFKRQLEASDDPDAMRRELEERYNLVRSPFRTAETFNVEEIIDPRDTRPLLCEWVVNAYRLVSQDLGPKARGLRP